MLLFAPLLFASSVIQLLTAIFTQKSTESFLHFAAAGLEMVLSIIVMTYPPESVAGLIGWVASIMIVVGLIRLARSLVTESRGKTWAVVAGTIAVLLGISIWIGRPVTALWVVGLCIALDFLCHGASWSALAFAERRQVQAPDV